MNPSNDFFVFRHTDAQAYEQITEEHLFFYKTLNDNLLKKLIETSAGFFGIEPATMKTSLRKREVVMARHAMYYAWRHFYYKKRLGEHVMLHEIYTQNQNYFEKNKELQKFFNRMRLLETLTLSALGRYMGQDHATVLNGIKVAEKFLSSKIDTEPRYRQSLKYIKQGIHRYLTEYVEACVFYSNYYLMNKSNKLGVVELTLTVEGYHYIEHVLKAHNKKNFIIDVKTIERNHELDKEINRKLAGRNS